MSEALYSTIVFIRNTSNIFAYAIEECLQDSNCSLEIDDDETILNWMTNYIYTWNPL